MKNDEFFKRGAADDLWKARCKILAITLTAFLLAAAIFITIDSPIATDAESCEGACGDGVGWYFSQETLLIYVTGDGNGAMEDYSDWKTPWRGLDFRYLIIDDGITYIGENAFRGCASLEAADIPESVTEIGAGAFFQCPSLEHVAIPSGITQINDYTFFMCESLETIDIPSGVVSIGEGAFQYCTSLIGIDLPSTLSYIGTAGFMYCDGLERVYIPDSVSNLNEWTFYGITFLESDGVTEVPATEIGGYTFAGTDGNLIKLDEREEDPVVAEGFCGEDLTWSFYNGTLTVSCTGSVGIMDDYSVYTEQPWNGLTITSIVIEEGVTAIGDRAFQYAVEADSVSLPSTLVSIGDQAFGLCLTLTSIELPEGLESIGDQAFENCQDLTSVNIPSTLGYMGDYCFANCISLEDLVIAEGLTVIPDHAFELCFSLQSLAIPDSVMYIGKNAFFMCNGLVQLTLGENLETIDDSAFHSCDNIAFVTIPSSVKYIGSQAFAFCDFSTILIPVTVDMIDDSAFTFMHFYYADGQTEITDYSDLPGYAYAGESGRKLVRTLPVVVDQGYCGESVTWKYYGERILKIEAVDGGDGVMADYYDGMAPWYENFYSLASVEIDEGVTTIGAYAFYYSYLEQISIPSTLTSIGECAFDDTEFFIDDVQVELTAENLAGKTWYGNGQGQMYCYTYEIYTVTFDPNGGVCDVESMKTNKDQRLDSLPDASKDSGKLKGWYTSPQGGKKVSTSTQFDGDTTVYAQWSSGTSFFDRIVEAIKDIIDWIFGSETV